MYGLCIGLRNYPGQADTALAESPCLTGAKAMRQGILRLLQQMKARACNEVARPVSSEQRRYVRVCAQGMLATNNRYLSSQLLEQGCVATVSRAHVECVASFPAHLRALTVRSVDEKEEMAVTGGKRSRLFHPTNFSLLFLTYTLLRSYRMDRLVCMGLCGSHRKLGAL